MLADEVFPGSVVPVGAGCCQGQVFEVKRREISLGVGRARPVRKGVRQARLEHGRDSIGRYAPSLRACFAVHPVNSFGRHVGLYCRHLKLLLLVRRSRREAALGGLEVLT